MTGPDCRELVLERLTLGTVKSLSNRPGVKDVYFDEKSGAESHLLNAWETTNTCTLPADLKQFYLTSNGFLLRWKVKMKDELIPLGYMEINPLSKLEKITFTCGSSASTLPDLDLTEEDDPDGKIPHFDSRSRVFEMDPCQGIGKVCLVYRNTKQGVPAKNGEYWFIDKSLEWHYITNTFQAYFRLMLKNLGLPHWQYLFTDIGISPRVEQWYSLYLPASNDSIGDTLMSVDTETAESATSNPLDSGRVFRGKDKKKPTLQNTNQPAGKKKVVSPVPNKSSATRPVQKSATNSAMR